MVGIGPAFFGTKGLRGGLGGEGHHDGEEEVEESGEAHEEQENDEDGADYGRVGAEVLAEAPGNTPYLAICSASVEHIR